MFKLRRPKWVISNESLHPCHDTSTATQGRCWVKPWKSSATSCHFEHLTHDWSNSIQIKHQNLSNGVESAIFSTKIWISKIQRNQGIMFMLGPILESSIPYNEWVVIGAWDSCWKIGYQGVSLGVIWQGNVNPCCGLLCRSHVPKI